MKEATISFFQKLLVIFLAILMFMTMVPVGLFPEDKTPSPEGSFVRYFPDMEVYAKTNDSETRQVSRYKSVYFRFNIGDLLKVKDDEIREVTLRLVFLSGSGEINNVVYINKILPENIPENPTGINLIRDKENEIARVVPYTLGNDDYLFETDVSEYVKRAIKDGKSEIAIKISADTDNPILMASYEYLDVAYRPCLKVVTGLAEDTDGDTLKKAELLEAVYVSQSASEECGSNLAGKDECLLVGGGNETYLRFSINKDAIVGSLYSARILLHLKDNSEQSKVRVYYLNNDKWDGNSIKYSDRPKGEEKTLAYAQIGEGCATIDVTQQVCEAVNNGMYDITFRLIGVSESTVLAYRYGDEAKKPRLCLKATDDKKIVCAAEAALSALGSNNESYVTMDLLNSYTASNGERAKISWSEYAEDKEYVQRYIDKGGRISRPKWFEGTARTLVMAEIQAGDYLTRRRYELILPPENKPAYTGYKFGNYLDIGDSDSEREQRFEYINMSGIKRRWVDGKILTYRSPEKNSAMVLNFKCSPYDVNYLTLKLWQGDAMSPQRLHIKPYDYKGEEMVVEVPEFEEESGGRVLYLTYALPKEFTNGSKNINLCVRFDGFENEPSRGVYGAYLTQSPYFEPKQFTSRGEEIVSESSFGTDAVEKFLSNLRRFFKIRDDGEIENTDADLPTIKTDRENKSVMFANNELNIALKKYSEKNTAIYQRTDYFDRYCADCGIESRNDVDIVDYGIYKIFINKNAEKIYTMKELNLDLSGMYKNMENIEYYAFNIDNKTADDSAIPEDKTILDGSSLRILPGGAVILKQVSKPTENGEWRVSGINGRSVEELTFVNTEKIDIVSVKAIGGINDNSERIKVICGVYENGKLVGMGTQETDVFEGINKYSLSFGDMGLYMNKNRSIRIFITEINESMTGILPKLELPI